MIEATLRGLAVIGIFAVLLIIVTCASVTINRIRRKA